MTRPATDRGADSQELVNEMRSLARAAERVPVVREHSEEDRAAIRVTTGLMLLLVMVLFVTAALPDLMPRLTHVMTAGF